MSRRYEIHGSPGPEEEAAVIAAIEQQFRQEELAKRPSVWKMAGRLLGVRSGVLDYRGDASVAGWTVSSWIPWSGRAYGGRHGRGDAK